MTTTARDLLERARITLGGFEQSPVPVSREQWDSFDQCVYRLLHELVRAAVGWSPADTHAAALHRAFRNYPQPLQPVGDQPDYTPREAARFLGITETAARKSIGAGELLAAPTARGYRVPKSELMVHGPVHPPSSVDQHPLGRLAYTVGALTDLLVLNRMDPAVPDLEAASAVTIAKDCLGIARAAATQTMSWCDPDVADRPLDIARYAARVLQLLPSGARLTGLQNPATASPDHEPLHGPDELEVAIQQWAKAAREALRNRVPSVEVLRDINRQGVHLYAALDSIVAGRAPSATTSDIRDQLRVSALTLQTAADAWSETTTGAPPSREYVAASRRLYSSLASITTPSRRTAPNAGVIYQSLLRGTSVLSNVVTSATPWAGRLLASEALFIHARHATPNARRLRAALSGRMVAATLADVPNLPVALWEAQRAAAQVGRTLPPTILQMADATQRVSSAQL